MEPENMEFSQFFSDRLKEKGYSLKKLSDVTGIAPGHLENLLHGIFKDLPSAPYFHGYLIRIGKVLDFDGEEWWARLKQNGAVKNAGELDMLPKNRFIKQAPPKYLWAIVAGIIVLIYVVLQFPRISGTPTLAITSPTQKTFTTASSTFVLAGTVKNADSLSLDGDNVTINADGTWQKGVLLQNGVNTFAMSAKKFLGGEADATVEIIYQAPGSSTTSATSTASSVTPVFPNVHIDTSTPINFN